MAIYSLRCIILEMIETEENSLELQILQFQALSDPFSEQNSILQCDYEVLRVFRV